MKRLNVASHTGVVLTALTLCAAAGAQQPAPHATAPVAPSTAAPPPAPAGSAAPSAAPAGTAAPTGTAPTGAAPEAAPPPPESAEPQYGEAGAETQQYPAPPPPNIYVETPPPPPPAPRHRHYHDGFYARFSMGPGWLWVHSDAEDVYEVTSKGWGYALDVMLGGTLRPGLVIGGGLLLQDALDPDVSVSGTAPSNASNIDQMSLVLLGPMIDGFPDPDGGFHVGGLLGIAVVPGFEGSDDKAPSGVGIAAWVGYQWWTSSEFSLGGVVRLATARTSASTGDNLDWTQNSRSVTLLFSALYH